MTRKLSAIHGQLPSESICKERQREEGHQSTSTVTRNQRFAGAGPRARLDAAQCSKSCLSPTETCPASYLYSYLVALRERMAVSSLVLRAKFNAQTRLVTVVSERAGVRAIKTRAPVHQSALHGQAHPPSNFLHESLLQVPLTRQTTCSLGEHGW